MADRVHTCIYLPHKFVLSAYATAINFLAAVARIKGITFTVVNKKIIEEFPVNQLTRKTIRTHKHMQIQKCDTQNLEYVPSIKQSLS